MTNASHLSIMPWSKLKKNTQVYLSNKVFIDFYDSMLLYSVSVALTSNTYDDNQLSEYTHIFILLK